MGDHEGGAGVVADEKAAGQVVFDLQGKQVPRGGKTERTMEECGREEETEGTEVARPIHTFVHG